MPIRSGSKAIVNAFHGSTAIKRVYLGDLLLTQDFPIPAGSPADIPGLSAWWDARDQTYLTYQSNTDVRVWNDRHSTNHLTQATVTKQADWANSRFGAGIGGLDFDRSDGYPVPFNVATTHTLFAVIIADVIDTTPQQVLGVGVTSNGVAGATIRVDNGAVRGIIGNGTSRSFSDSAAVTGTIYRVIHRWDAGNNRIMVNGAEPDNEAHSLGALGTAQMGLGANGSAVANNFFDGKICMAGIYSGKYLSDAEAAQLASILAELVP